jgi:putative DNA primase/helicase
VQALLGKSRVCSPTLSSLATDFGKQVLIEKAVALIADARLSGRTDSAVVVERLLSISGEDPQTVARKYLPDWNGTLVFTSPLHRTCLHLTHFFRVNTVSHRSLSCSL